MNESFHLGDFADIILGYPFESEKFNTEGQGVCLVRGMNVTEQALRFGSDARYWSHDISGLDKYLLKTNDIVIGMDGSKVGRNFSIVREEYLPLLLVQRVACVRAKNEVLQPFLWAMISSRRFVDYIDTVKTGSSIFHISGEQIANYPLPFFSDDEMMAIGQCIWSIDAKIANNNAICSNLEAMAKLLYDYWFVQFDYPDDNGKPYKSSGGKMVWNDELKREIPAGWEVKRLSDIAQYSSDKISATELSSENYIGIDNLLPDMRGRVPSDYTPTDGLAVKFVPKDVLIGNIRPYFKKIWFADVEGGCSPDVLAIRSITEENSIFVYSSLARDDFFLYDMAGSKGSKMPRGDKDHIMRYPVAYNSQVSQQYVSKVTEWFSKMTNCYYENQYLAALRDFLLPLLMNGQVKLGKINF